MSAGRPAQTVRFASSQARVRSGSGLIWFQKLLVDARSRGLCGSPLSRTPERNRIPGLHSALRMETPTFCARAWKPFNGPLP
jgi:hypothetical protein